MSAYEVALGLEVGQISSITGYIKASIPGLKTRVVRPEARPDSRAFAERLDELIDITETGRAPGPGLAGVRLAPGRGPDGAPASPGLGGAQPPARRAAAAVDQGLLPAARAPRR